MNIGDNVGRALHVCGERPPEKYRPQQPDPCGLPAGHEGGHADISYSGLVLTVWGDPQRQADSAGLDTSVLDVLRRIGQVAEDLQQAIRSAESEIYSIGHEHKDDLLIQEIVSQCRLPDEYEVEPPFDWGDEDSWEQAVETIRGSKGMKWRLARQRREAS